MKKKGIVTSPITLVIAVALFFFTPLFPDELILLSGNQFNLNPNQTMAILAISTILFLMVKKK